MKRIAVGLIGLIVGTLLFGAAIPAWAQSAVKDSAGTVTAANAKKQSWFQEKFSGSFVEAGLYVGSGSFYATGYRNPYLSGSLYIRPRFNLGTKVQLSLNARIYQLLEFTQPDEPTDRRWVPLDTWVWLSAGNLFTEKRTGIKLSGQFRIVIPSSYESVYSNLALGMALGFSLSKNFKLPKDVGISLSLGAVATKNFHRHIYRGNGPGDTTGCRGLSNPSAAGTAAIGEIATVSDTDTCGGSLNTSVSVVSSGSLGLSWKKLSFGVTLIFVSAFKYSFPKDQFTSTHAVSRGQVDSTWGLLSVGYDINDHFGLSLGLSSSQPAKTADNKGYRFPFFDFQSGNYANNTQVFASVAGTL